MVPDTLHGLRPDPGRLLILHISPYHGPCLGQSTVDFVQSRLSSVLFHARLKHCVLIQANELLLSGRKLTAQEACSKGLVSQVLWPGTFTQEVMLRIRELVTVDSMVSCTLYLLCMHLLNVLNVGSYPVDPTSVL